MVPWHAYADFTGSFDERMSQLHSILSDKTDWILIGSSFGGLMGTVFTLDHATQVRKLILLAPASRLAFGPETCFRSNCRDPRNTGYRGPPRTCTRHGAKIMWW